MGFIDELKQAESKKTIAHAKSFAAEVKPKLIASAEEGYNGYNIQLTGRDDAHLLRKELFLETLQSELGGCTVKLDSTEHTDLLFKTKFRKYFVNISWKGEA